MLAGGGNQAVSEVGMLRALLERGITPDVIVGTSAGAWNGSVLAANPTVGGVESLIEMWESIRGEDVFPGGKLSRAWNLLTRDDHLFSDQGLRTLLEKAATPDTFDELVVPLRVVACDLDSGEEVVFARGPLVPALLASAALPGLFPPVRHDGRTLVDGAVVNTVPLWHALSGPVDRIYVLTVTGELMRRPLRSPIDVAIRAFTISRKQRFELELRSVPPGIEVHVLPGTRRRPRVLRLLGSADADRGGPPHGGALPRPGGGRPRGAIDHAPLLVAPLRQLMLPLEVPSVAAA